MGALGYYKALGVRKAATGGDIRKAYHRRALRWHPDKNPGNREEAERRFKQLLEAYEALKDPLNRAEYDRLAAAKEKVPPPAAAARATSCGARGSGMGRAPKNTGCDGTGGAKCAGGSARSGAGRGAGAGGADTGAANGAPRPGGPHGASGARPGEAGYWGCRYPTFYPTGGSWSTHSPQSTGESGRNEYTYQGNAGAGENLYGEDARGGDFRYDYGAGVGDNFYGYAWDFYDTDDCDIEDCDDDHYDEYADGGF